MQNHYLITGASRGIGFEMVRHLAGQHHRITAVARSQKKLEKLAGLYPEQVSAFTMDITNEKDRKRLTDHFTEKNITLQGIVHNAGLLINKPFSRLTNSDWQNQVDVNLLAPVFLTRDLISFLDHDSHIVNISSMGGYQGSSKFPGLTGYSVAKGALSILAECLANELNEQKISCNSLCLGAVQTEMLENAFPGMEAPVQTEKMGAYISEFLQTGHQFYNGKILPVALSDPS